MEFYLFIYYTMSDEITMNIEKKYSDKFVLIYLNNNNREL